MKYSTVYIRFTICLKFQIYSYLAAPCSVTLVASSINLLLIFLPHYVHRGQLHCPVAQLWAVLRVNIPIPKMIVNLLFHARKFPFIFPHRIINCSKMCRVCEKPRGWTGWFTQAGSNTVKHMLEFFCFFFTFCLFSAASSQTISPKKSDYFYLESQ